MNIEINTSTKTLVIKEDISLGQFLEEIDKILPNWKEYKLKSEVKSVDWNWYPTYPATQPPYSWKTDWLPPFTITC